MGQNQDLPQKKHFCLIKFAPLFPKPRSKLLRQQKISKIAPPPKAEVLSSLVLFKNQHGTRSQSGSLQKSLQVVFPVGTSTNPDQKRKLVLYFICFCCFSQWHTIISYKCLALIWFFCWSKTCVPFQIRMTQAMLNTKPVCAGPVLHQVAKLSLIKQDETSIWVYETFIYL
jgi:hypothetical protein